MAKLDGNQMIFIKNSKILYIILIIALFDLLFVINKYMKYNKSLHPYFKLSIFWTCVKSPMSLYCISIKFTLIKYCMGSNVLFSKSNCSCIIIKTALKYKFSNWILTSPFHITLWNWINIKIIKLHFILLTELNIMTSPLSRLSKVGHLVFDSNSKTIIYYRKWKNFNLNLNFDFNLI